MSRLDWNSVGTQPISRAAGKSLSDAMMVCPSTLTAHLPPDHANWYTLAYRVAFEVAQRQVQRQSHASRWSAAEN